SRAGPRRDAGDARARRVGRTRCISGDSGGRRHSRRDRDLPAPADVVMSTARPSRRAVHMVQRNLLVYKHEWMVIFSGFFEPLFYLLGIGLGVGAMVPKIGGVSYIAFVAPALLAASCMNGAMSDGFYNVFFKLKYKKTYDGVIATP